MCTGAAINGRLRGATTRRHGAKKTTRHVGRADGKQLLVGERARLTWFCKCARRGNAFSKAHQSNACGPGPHLFQESKVRPHPGWKVARNFPDRFNSHLGQSKHSGSCNSHADGDQRRWCSRHKALQANHQPNHEKSQHQRYPRCLGQVLNHSQDVAKETCLHDMEAKQLWDLIHHNDQSNASLETCQHRFQMKLAIKPRRRTDARRSIAPTSKARVALATINSPAPPFGATFPNSAAVRIAMVVVVLTLSGLDVPSST